MTDRALAPSRRSFMRSVLALPFASLAARSQTRPPNVIMIYADDLGYGDLGCYGSSIPTPNLDKMAGEGIRLTSFYSASPVCSPSRAALLTGRYPVRVGVPRVLDPDAKGGIAPTETLLPEMLKAAGYATMCIGKWHLGTTAGYRPTERGFDAYFGIPYSNDMWPRPLMRNNDVIQATADLTTITAQYTQEAQQFITRSKDKPFFLYLPHTFPHIPLAASPAFRGKSGHGLYGDTVQELDWSVGEIFKTLQDLDLDNNTLVIFSSDNGPWYQGSPGKLRGRKGEIFDGGMREPFIARFPGRIPAGQVSGAVTNTMDVLPTIACLSGVPLPAKTIDGVDIWPLLSGQDSDVSRDVFLYFNDIYLQAARVGPWKLHVARFNTPAFTPDPKCGRSNLPLSDPELYHMVNDPEEGYDRAERNPDVVADIRSRMEKAIRTFPPEVQDAWTSTMCRRVFSMPAGALPLEDVKP